MAKATGIVALLTDYGLQDPYAGLLKGALLSVNPQARPVDLTHEVPPQDVREGSRILAAALPYFPAGTIFVAVVDPGVGTDRAIVGVETDRHFLLAPVAGHLSRGVDLAKFGPVVKKITVLDEAAPSVAADGALRGEVVSIDRFGNLITNIPGDLLPDARR